MTNSTVQQLITRNIETRFGQRQYPNASSILGPTIENLAKGCDTRGITFKQVKEAIANVSHKIQTPEEMNMLLSRFAGDLNLIPVFQQAPEHLLRPQLMRILKTEQLDLLGLKTLLFKLGFPKPIQDRVAQHARWVKYAREARRLLSSGEFLNDRENVEALQRSFDHTYGQHSRSLDENRKVVDWLTKHGLEPYMWLREPFEQQYDESLSRKRNLDNDAKIAIHMTLYKNLDELSSILGQKNTRFLSIFSNYKQLSPKEKPEEFIKEANTFFKNYGGLTQGKYPQVPEELTSKYKVQISNLNQMLLELIGRIQKHVTITEDKKAVVSPKMNEILDDLVALQRTVAPYDPKVALTTKMKDIEPGTRTKYIIKKSNKDPIHFFTGGNDTGVCHSTTGNQAHMLKYLAQNYAIQFHEVFRENPDGTRKRIGQISLYLGEDKEGKPVLLGNSIDFEAGERQNLALYRRAIDYTKEYAKKVGFTRILLGRHCDMLLRPFEDEPIFSDLEPAEEYVKLVHYFPKEHMLSDFFPESVHAVAGTIKAYTLHPQKKGP